MTMGTVHRDACEFHAKTWMNDPQGRSVLTEYLWKLQSDFFDKAYQDVFMQKYMGKPDFADAYAFAGLHMLMCSGEIASFKVDIGKSPLLDSQTEENNRILNVLQRSRSSPKFRAVFVPGKGGSADDDGIFSWADCVDASIITEPPNKTARVVLDPMQVPLEVGYTEASKTLIHLRGEGGVARWPYGHNELTILVLCEDDNPLDSREFSWYDEIEPVQR
jgi:hypothetical protein